MKHVVLIIGFVVVNTSAWAFEGDASTTVNAQSLPASANVIVVSSQIVRNVIPNLAGKTTQRRNPAAIDPKIVHSVDPSIDPYIVYTPGGASNTDQRAILPDWKFDFRNGDGLHALPPDMHLSLPPDSAFKDQLLDSLGLDNKKLKDELRRDLKEFKLELPKHLQGWNNDWFEKNGQPLLDNAYPDANESPKHKK